MRELLEIDLGEHYLSMTRVYLHSGTLPPISKPPSSLFPRHRREGFGMSTIAQENVVASLSAAVGRQLAIRRAPLCELHMDPSNARHHPRRNLDAIQESLARFGQVEPLIILKSTGRVVGGNGRLAAMKAMGWEYADVVELDLTATEAAALAIALNRTAELAEWDDVNLPQILAALRTENALDGIGFNANEVDELLRDAGIEVPSTVDDPGPLEPPVKPVTQLGDVWELGDHRLMCGDSTSTDDVARLMNGEKATLLATDPPYLVGYQGGNHPQSWANKADVKDKHWDDYVDPTTGLEFFSAWLKAALPHCIERVPVYQWHATRRQVLVEEAWKRNGLLVHQTIIWVKSRPVLTRSLYMWQHEPCFVGWPEGFMPEPDRRPPPSERTVWQIDQVGQQDGIHPTQKALEIFARPIRFHTREGEVVLEPFSGSGTQIVAAESLRRRCRAMEISPPFVDAALRRWEQASGKKAVLAGTSKSIEALAVERHVP
ncbi:MAG: DNA modification methylase [Planctomycetes bacterium]|nr:DNA modification methylase [Planctomycetota bacterium]